MKKITLYNSECVTEYINKIIKIPMNVLLKKYCLKKDIHCIIFVSHFTGWVDPVIFS